MTWLTPIIENWLTPANKKKKFHDPWRRFEAWRYLPENSFKAKIPHLFPGFFWGIGAFLLFWTIEEIYYYKKNNSRYSTLIWYQNKKNQ